MKAKPAEAILSLAVLALGIGVAVGASQLSSAGGYARVGPNAAPAVIAGGFILLGIWLPTKLYPAAGGMLFRTMRRSAANMLFMPARSSG